MVTLGADMEWGSGVAVGVEVVVVEVQGRGTGFVSCFLWLLLRVCCVLLRVCVVFYSRSNFCFSSVFTCLLDVFLNVSLVFSLCRKTCLARSMSSFLFFFQFCLLSLFFDVGL